MNILIEIRHDNWDNQENNQLRMKSVNGLKINQHLFIPIRLKCIIWISIDNQY